MKKARSTAKVIPFPDIGLWSVIAKKYVDNVVYGDPRAAFYYLEYQLDVLRLSKPPPALKIAIEKEYRRRGFRGPVRFDDLR